MNLCSKCFADIQRSSRGEDCTSKPIQSTGSSQSPVFSSETSIAVANPYCRRRPLPPSSRQPKSPRPRFPARGKACRPQKQPKAHSAHPQNVHENQRRARERGDAGEAATDRRAGGSSEEARGTPNKEPSRCFRCQTKLELVQQELGSCRCEASFLLVGFSPTSPSILTFLLRALLGAFPTVSMLMSSTTRGSPLKVPLSSLSPSGGVVGVGRWSSMLSHSNLQEGPGLPQRNALCHTDTHSHAHTAGASEKRSSLCEL
ncbi:hypothetical protein FQN60_010604, partial [Etheostoma spectabile]